MAVAKKVKTSETVSTSSLISQVADKHLDTLPKKLTKQIVQDFLQAIEFEISSKHSKVRIDRLGIIQVKDRAARKGRNPQTGEEIKIPASKKISFRAARSLKDAVGIKKAAPRATAAVKKRK